MIAALYREEFEIVIDCTDLEQRHANVLWPPTMRSTGFNNRREHRIITLGTCFALSIKDDQARQHGYISSNPSYALLALYPSPQYTVIPHQPVRLSINNHLTPNAMHMLSTIFPPFQVACSGLKLPLSGAISGCHCAMNVIAAPHIFVSTRPLPISPTLAPSLLFFLFSFEYPCKKGCSLDVPHIM